MGNPMYFGPIFCGFSDLDFLLKIGKSVDLWGTGFLFRKHHFVDSQALECLR